MDDRRRRQAAAPRQGVDRAGVEAAAPARRGDPPAEPVAGRFPRDVRRGDPVPAGRPERRLRARDVGLEGLGPGDDGRGDRGRGLRRRQPPGARRGPDDAPDREPRLRAFCLNSPSGPSGGRSTDEQKRLYIDRQFEEAPDPETAVKRVVLLVLKSPRFLYREIGGGTDAYDVASRLSFGLWDSLPDAAAPRRPRRRASSPRRSRWPRQAERMLADLRSRSKLREFFLQWLKVDQVRDLAKDPSSSPEFNEVDRLRPADLARPVPGGCRLGRGLGFPPVAPGGLPVPERSAGEVLRRRPPARRPVPEGHARTRESGPGCSRTPT